MDISFILLFSILANLDGLIVGLSYGIKRIRISVAAYLLIALITSAGTLLSMYLGRNAAQFMPPAVASVIGGVIMMGIGLAGLIKYYRGKRSPPSDEVQWPVEHPEKYDKNHNRRIDYNETIALAIALSVNNIGLGIGASISGLAIVPTTIAVFFFSILFMLAGNLLGKCFLCKLIGKRAELISAVCVIALGVWEIFF